MSWRAGCTDTCCVGEPDTDYRVLRRGFVKRTRKPHPCSYCTVTIAPGSPAYTVTVLGEGRVFTDYRHVMADCESAP